CCCTTSPCVRAIRAHWQRCERDPHRDSAACATAFWARSTRRTTRRTPSGLARFASKTSTWKGVHDEAHRDSARIVLWFPDPADGMQHHWRRGRRHRERRQVDQERSNRAQALLNSPGCLPHRIMIGGYSCEI